MEGEGCHNGRGDRWGVGLGVGLDESDSKVVSHALWGVEIENSVIALWQYNCLIRRGRKLWQ